MRAALFTFVFLLSILKLSAQYNINQNKNWVFGHHAGLSFNSGSPAAFTSTIDVPEGCASVSSATGSLLFFTDGKKVWNRNGSIMPSGSAIVSFNTAGATQSTTILPVIGDPDRYYVFSVEQAGGAGTLAYSIVDMRLAGGLGDVESSGMGTVLGTSLAEKITTIAGGCNAWVLVHRRDIARFLAFEVTTSGINTTAVVSNYTGSFTSYDSGVIKADPTGRKVVCQAMSSTGQGGTEKFDFDASTGAVFNYVLLNPFNGNYGAEFSPSGSLLYVINNNGGAGSTLVQYNLVPAVPTPANITTVTAGSKRDLKLAPDGKIYFPAFGGTGSLDVIGSPDLVGAGCGYAAGAVSLAPNTCEAGMPNVYNFAGPTLITGGSKVCAGATITLSNSGGGGTWSSSNASVATVTAGIVTGVTTGTAIITVTLSPGCYTTYPIEVVNALTTPNTGALKLCVGTTSSLGNATAGGTWSSSDATVATIGSLSGVATGIGTGTCIIAYSLGGGCIASSVMSVSILSAPATITGTTEVCEGVTTTLTASVSGGKWTSVNTAIAKVDSISGVVTGLAGGIDTIKYTLGGGTPCATTASVVVTVNAAPSAGVIHGASPICNGATVTIDATQTDGVWTCNDSSKINLIPFTAFHLECGIKALNTGSVTISYTVKGGNGCYGHATFNLAILPEAPFVTTGHVSPATCYGSNDGSIYVTFTGGTGQYQYHWSNGATDAAVNGLVAGTYTVSVEDPASKCSRVDAFTVTQPDSFSVSATLTDDKCNEGKGKISVTTIGTTGPFTYLWQNSTTADEISGLHAGTYSLTVTDTAKCSEKLQFALKDVSCGDIVVYDVITPNNDGANDTWSIAGIQYYATSTVQVFDKWGDVVFEQTGYKNDWSGIGKGGSPVPDGTYYYLVKLNAPNTFGGKETFTGALMIKR